MIDFHAPNLLPTCLALSPGIATRRPTVPDFLEPRDQRLDDFAAITVAALRAIRMNQEQLSHACRIIYNLVLDEAKDQRLWVKKFFTTRWT
jgi:hypothetical protein